MSTIPRSIAQANIRRMPPKSRFAATGVFRPTTASTTSSTSRLAIDRAGRVSSRTQLAPEHLLDRAPGLRVPAQVALGVLLDHGLDAVLLSF